MKNVKNTILGIDPGIGITGWAIIEYSAADKSKRILDYGAIKTKPNAKVEDRLIIIYDELEKIVEKFNPEIAAIEKIFHFKNSKTIISVGEARGVVLLLCKVKELEVVEYTPLQIKQAISGYGRATKSQVQKMVKLLLNLEYIPKPDDAADAAAIAYTYTVFFETLDRYK